MTKRYDNKGNLIYIESPTGNKLWYDYDCNNRCTYIRESNGRICTFEYNGNGKIIRFTEDDGKGLKISREYREDGSSIHYRKYNDFVERREYDSNYNLINFSNSNGVIMRK